MNLQTFIDLWNGKYNNYDGGFGPQCKDLFSQYNKDVAGNPNYVSGDAWKLYDAAPAAYYEKFINTPSFVPRAGDVCIWKQSFGGFGHVGIVVSATVSKMQIFGQNYPSVTVLNSKNQLVKPGSPCQIVSMNYNGVHGFLRPKKLQVAPPVQPNPPKEEPVADTPRETFRKIWITYTGMWPEETDLGKSALTAFEASGKLPWQYMQDAFLYPEDALRQAQIKGLNDSIKNLNDRIGKLETSVDDKNKEIEAKDQEIQQLRDELNKPTPEPTVEGAFERLLKAIDAWFKRSNK